MRHAQKFESVVNKTMRRAAHRRQPERPKLVRNQKRAAPVSLQVWLSKVRLSDPLPILEAGQPGFGTCDVWRCHAIRKQNPVLALLCGENSHNRKALELLLQRSRFETVRFGIKPH